jgi:peptide chain release factor 3
VHCEDRKKLDEFRTRNEEHLAIDGGGYLTYLATSRVNLQVMEERWPDITFTKTREH